MKQVMKNATLVLSLTLGAGAMAEVGWKNYSTDSIAMAEKSGKAVILGFHKKGCGTCAAQDAALEKAGVKALSNVETVRVERKDSSMDAVYEKYGFNKKQWAALVLLKNGKEVARLEPGTTDETKIKEFLAKAN